MHTYVLHSKVVFSLIRFFLLLYSLSISCYFIIYRQKHLYNVLRAYTAYNPADGFCQAHAPIVSVLLMHMPEEDAFWCLIALLDKYLPGYYSGQLVRYELLSVLTQICKLWFLEICGLKLR